MIEILTRGLALSIALVGFSANASEKSSSLPSCITAVLNGNLDASIADENLSLGSSKVVIRERLNFDGALEAGNRLMAVQDKSGRHAAVVVGNRSKDGKTVELDLQIVDTAEKKVVFSSLDFTHITSLTFIDGASKLAVNGTKTNDGQVAKLYVVDFENPKKTFTTTLSALPGSPYRGTGVVDVLGAPDLQRVVVFQNSFNPLRTMKLKHAIPMVDPNTSVFNQGAYVYDTDFVGSTLRESLSYPDGLVPIAGLRSPHSDLLALHVRQPVIAYKQRESVIVVDLKNPEAVVYRYDLPIIDRKIDLAFSWSLDGRILTIAERQTGTLVAYDVKTKTEAGSPRGEGRPWPIAGAHTLQDDSLLVIRHGSEIQKKDLAMALVGTIASLTHIPGENPAATFSVHLSDDQTLSQRVRNRYMGVVGINSVIELKNGKILALVLDDQIVLIDRAQPRNQIILTPRSLPAEKFGPFLPSVIKVSEDTLRFVDRDNGVFDATIAD